MGNFLLQRGLLIYVLTPRSCDLYMIFYIIYEFCLFVFVWSNKLEISFNCLFLSGWSVMIKGAIRKRGLLRNEAVIDGRC